MAENDKLTEYVYRIDYVDGTNMKFDTDIDINLSDIRINYQGHGALSFNDIWINLSHVKQITKSTITKEIRND